MEDCGQVQQSGKRAVFEHEGLFRPSPAGTSDEKPLAIPPRRRSVPHTLHHSEKCLAQESTSSQNSFMDKPSSSSSKEKHQSLHEKLWKICKTLPEDYEPYGSGLREEGGKWYGDCSCGCKYYLPLEGKLGADWGVCRNQKSHRCGLLTFEHQGCRHFELDESSG